MSEAGLNLLLPELLPAAAPATGASAVEPGPTPFAGLLQSLQPSEPLTLPEPVPAVALSNEVHEAAKHASAPQLTVGTLQARVPYSLAAVDRGGSQTGVDGNAPPPAPQALTGVSQVPVSPTAPPIPTALPTLATSAPTAAEVPSHAGSQSSAGLHGLQYSPAGDSPLAQAGGRDPMPATAEALVESLQGDTRRDADAAQWRAPSQQAAMATDAAPAPETLEDWLEGTAEPQARPKVVSETPAPGTNPNVPSPPTAAAAPASPGTPAESPTVEMLRPVAGTPSTSGRPDWLPGLGEQLGWMAREEVDAARLRLNPRELGSLDIRITLEADQVRVAVDTANAQVRDELLEALPRLRQLLAEQGLSLADLDVGQPGNQDADAQSPGPGAHPYAEAESPVEAQPVYLPLREGGVSIFA